jgi:Bacterial aa3 type cytochrome c oxidase subunit IV
VTPALKAARTAFNFPCVKGAVITSTFLLREVSSEAGSGTHRTIALLSPLCRVIIAGRRKPGIAERCCPLADKDVGGNHRGHERQYHTFVTLTKWFVAVIAVVSILMAIFLT